MGNQIEFLPPVGGIHLWCKIDSSINEHTLLEESISNGVVFVLGTILGYQKGYVCFTFGRGELSVIRQGVTRFAEAYHTLKKG